MYSWNNISSVNRIETQFRSVANGLASRRADEDKMTTYSNKKMRENLGKSIDEKKLQTMMELKRAYNAGEITLEEGRKRAKAELGTLEPYEFAVAEQGQQSLDPDECRKEDIQAMIDLFSDVLSTKRPELPADHPLSHYYQENDTLRGILKEIEDLPACKKYAKDVKVSMYMYDRPAWTGHVYETECFFPTWINKASAPHVQALVDAHHALWGDTRLWADETAREKREGRPLTDKWTFSTNGVSIQGRYGIPCVGFGPGAESQAHAPNEITWKQDLVVCAALYAAVPMLYKPENKDGSATSFRQELTGNDIK
mgnify:CR=1 FL=1